jgi:hypothetical protein
MVGSNSNASGRGRGKATARKDGGTKARRKSKAKRPRKKLAEIAAACKVADEVLTNVPTVALAAIVQSTTKEIESLVQVGLPRNDNGTFHLAKAVPWILEWRAGQKGNAKHRGTFMAVWSPQEFQGGGGRVPVKPAVGYFDTLGEASEWLLGLGVAVCGPKDYIRETHWSLPRVRRAETAILREHEDGKGWDIVHASSVTYRLRPGAEVFDLLPRQYARDATCDVLMDEIDKLQGTTRENMRYLGAEHLSQATAHSLRAKAKVAADLCHAAGRVQHGLEDAAAYVDGKTAHSAVTADHRRVRRERAGGVRVGAGS